MTPDIQYNWDAIPKLDNYVERRIEWVAAASSGISFLSFYSANLEYLLAGPIFLPPFLTFCYSYFYKDLETDESNKVNLLKRKRLFVMLNSISVVWGLTYVAIVFIPIWPLQGWLLYLPLGLAILSGYLIYPLSSKWFSDAVIDCELIKCSKTLSIRRVLKDSFIMVITQAAYPFLSFIGALAPYSFYALSFETQQHTFDALVILIISSIILLLMLCLLFLAKRMKLPLRVTPFTTRKIVEILRSPFSMIFNPIYPITLLAIGLGLIVITTNIANLQYSTILVIIALAIPCIAWLKYAFEFIDKMNRRRHKLGRSIESIREFPVSYFEQKKTSVQIRTPVDICEKENH
ncbi:MAG: hypothetical protein R6V83_00525 [Candidatus Thorarchaeota archaeon]